MPGSFIGQRGRGVEDMKTIILHISPGMASHVCVCVCVCVKISSGRGAGFSEAGHYV